MSKLSDTQLTLLSRAAQSQDRVAALPEKLKGAAAAKVLRPLIARKLLGEIRAKPGMPAWRHAEDGPAYALVLTGTGRQAIGIEATAAETAVPERKSNRISRKRQLRAPRRKAGEGRLAPRRGEPAAPDAADVDAASAV